MRCTIPNRPESLSHRAADTRSRVYSRSLWKRPVGGDFALQHLLNRIVRYGFAQCRRQKHGCTAVLAMPDLVAGHTVFGELMDEFARQNEIEKLVLRRGLPRSTPEKW